MRKDFTDWISQVASRMHGNQTIAEAEEASSKEAPEACKACKDQQSNESAGSMVDGMSVKELVRELQKKLREEYATDADIVIAPANGMPQKIVSVDTIIDTEEDDVVVVVNTEDYPEAAHRFDGFNEAEDDED